MKSLLTVASMLFTVTLSYEVNVFVAIFASTSDGGDVGTSHEESSNAVAANVAASNGDVCFIFWSPYLIVYESALSKSTVSVSFVFVVVETVAADEGIQSSNCSALLDE